jgi:hypothetical protein
LSVTADAPGYVQERVGDALAIGGIHLGRDISGLRLRFPGLEPAYMAISQEAPHFLSIWNLKDRHLLKAGKLLGCRLLRKASFTSSRVPMNQHEGSKSPVALNDDMISALVWR